jgi:hypothetical protein
MNNVRAGQRWLWASGEDSTIVIVEVMEDTDIDYDGTVRCKIVQWLSGYRYGSVGHISFWDFAETMNHWTYLSGQDSPL